MWAVSFCSICYFVLITPFIKIWLGESFVLGFSVVLIISLNIFFNSGGQISSAFINAMGLFVRDKARPLFQAIINLVVSILLVVKIGIVGVFIGTLVSNLCTTWWRFGILLYCDVFKKNVFRYYGYFFFWTFLTLCGYLLFYFICRFLPGNFGGLILKFLVCGIGINLIYILIFFKNSNFIYYRNLLIKKIAKRK